MNNIFSNAACACIRFYQKRISCFFPNTCRFHPSCSEYMYQSIRQKGLISGIFNGILRLMRCNPLFEGGFDHAGQCQAKDNVRQKIYE